MKQSIRLVATVIGFLTALAFFMAFWLLGYSLGARLTLAVAGGVAIGRIWWGWNSGELVKQHRQVQKYRNYGFRRPKRPNMVEAQRNEIRRRQQASARSQSEEQLGA